jgi:hypothetical protein
MIGKESERGQALNDVESEDKALNARCVTSNRTSRQQGSFVELGYTPIVQK